MIEHVGSLRQGQSQRLDQDEPRQTGHHCPVDARLARSMWTVYEPVHAVAYFAPTVRSRFEQAGVRGFWRSYFAGRAAPLGRTGPSVVQAAFFSFAPQMVDRAIPSVWELIDPDTAWAMRSSAAAEALRGCCEGIDRDEVHAAERLLRTVVDRLDPGGRIFFAAHLRLDQPDEPVESIWHACTLLREHRGDGHIAAAIGEGLSSLDLLVLTDKLSITPVDHAVDNRGWSRDQWDERIDYLTRLGMLDASGNLTAAGRSAREAIEARTDVAAQDAWASLDPHDLKTLYGCLRRISESVTNFRHYLSYPNPIGVPSPDDKPLPHR